MYSGLRWAFLCIAAFAAAAFGLAVCFVWPPLQQGVHAITRWIAASGELGIFLYGFLERLLIPTGLHHLIYMPFQFSALGGSVTVGSVTYTGAYTVTMAEYSNGLPLTGNIVWMYTGFTKTFGYLGIAAAFIFTARKERRKQTAAAILPLAVTASLASISPSRWTFSSASSRRCSGCSMRPSPAGSWSVLNALHVRAFTSNLLGSLVFNLSAAPGQTSRAALLYLLGLAEMAVYFVVFTVVIRALEPAHARPHTGAGADGKGDRPGGRPAADRSAGQGRTTSARWTTASPGCAVTVRDTSLLDTASPAVHAPQGPCAGGAALRRWGPAAYRRPGPGGCWRNSSNSARRSELLPFFGRM